MMVKRSFVFGRKPKDILKDIDYLDQLVYRDKCDDDGIVRYDDLISAHEEAALVLLEETI
jgi:hypothetical protein